MTPLLPYLLLLRHRSQLEAPEVKRRLGFLFCNYTLVPSVEPLFLSLLSWEHLPS